MGNPSQRIDRGLFVKRNIPSLVEVPILFEAAAVVRHTRSATAATKASSTSGTAAGSPCTTVVASFTPHPSPRPAARTGLSLTVTLNETIRREMKRERKRQQQRLGGVCPLTVVRLLGSEGTEGAAPTAADGGTTAVHNPLSVQRRPEASRAWPRASSRTSDDDEDAPPTSYRLLAPPARHCSTSSIVPRLFDDGDAFDERMNYYT